ncbi:55 kDa B regulatory subunit of phosphatase 2A [Zostera marina]|uniref:Serine/threonine-protein phosphatase 2A 55 kDa regulatory subunit B n=1 Tax=Zostera marina TaxID=29655 RepID=A0A0K9PUS6_ZOSMR|nr:55 kDa B regulatory subunit of phosphatase 2A [Zostera marina]
MESKVSGYGRNQKDSGMEWKLSQVFGERASLEKVTDVDVISTIQFDKTGDFLAVGDHGGRLILFERVYAKPPYSREELERSNGAATSVLPRYTYLTEIQSHEPEIDHLYSLEIEEKINKLRWCPTLNNSLFILSTNNRTIKLWKIRNRKVKRVKEMSLNAHVSSENALLSENSFAAGQDGQFVPNSFQIDWIDKKYKLLSTEFREKRAMIINNMKATSRCRRIYTHAHEYNVNSISINSDGETFISADNLRVNLWNLEISSQCFNIIDIKPPNMEDLIEVITTAEFHPTYCNLLAYGSSRGFIRLVDMRTSALCDQSARILHARENPPSSSFFSGIVKSISDIKFGVGGMQVLSRDYMNLKLWDLRMEKSPVLSFKVHEHLRPKLAELYNNDSVFDKFECCLSADEFHFATGSYSNTFKVFSCDAGNSEGIILEASKNPNRRMVNVGQTAHKSRSWINFARSINHRDVEGSNSNFDNEVRFPCDTTSKLTHMAWHPTRNLIACAAANSIYMMGYT